MEVFCNRILIFIFINTLLIGVPLPLYASQKSECVKSVFKVFSVPKVFSHKKKIKEYWDFRRRNILNYNEYAVKKMSGFNHFEEYENLYRKGT